MSPVCVLSYTCGTGARFPVRRWTRDDGGPFLIIATLFLLCSRIRPSSHLHRGRVDASIWPSLENQERGGLLRHPANGDVPVLLHLADVPQRELVDRRAVREDDRRRRVTKKTNGETKRAARNTTNERPHGKQNVSAQ